MRYDHARLDNGLELVGEYNPEALSLAAGFFCRTGARDETGAESGVSHFLEHMMFKGTERLSYDDINKTFDRLGARYNAFTSEENTVYYGQVLPEFQRDIIGLLSEMMRPALRDEDFGMEKNVILEEIAMYEDYPVWVAHDHCRARFFAGHPLGNSVLGTTASITALQRDQMADYFARRYAADNLTFAISGAYDWSAAVQQVGELCGGWSPSQPHRALDQVDPEPGLEAMATDKFTQAHIYLLAPGLAAQDPDRLAASVAAAAIGSGYTSRLHWALVHPGLAESAWLGHQEADQAGHYSGLAVCEPEKAQEAVDIYRGELAKVQDEGLAADEVSRAIRRFGSGLVLQAETPLHRLVNVGFDWVYRREVTPLADLTEQIRAVTVEDCNRVLSARPFDHLAAVCVGPVEVLH